MDQLLEIHNILTNEDYYPFLSNYLWLENYASENGLDWEDYQNSHSQLIK